MIRQHSQQALHYYGVNLCSLEGHHGVGGGGGHPTFLIVDTNLKSQYIE